MKKCYLQLTQYSTLLVLCSFLMFSQDSICQNIVINPYLQNLTSSECTIMWEAADIGSGEVIWGADPFSMSSTVVSTSETGNGTSRIHLAVLQGLNFGTKYYYKVRMAGGEESKMYTFKTLQNQDSNQNTQFVAISDMQRDGSKPDKFREIVEEGIIPIIYSEIGDSLYDLEAILIPGDLVVTGGNYAQWKDHFFSKSDSLTGNVPLYPVPGNHEYFSGGLPNFKKYFSLPENGPVGLQDENWYKDISNVRIIGLNSNSGSGDQNLQLNWLSTVLDSTCYNEHIDFVFAELHHPYKSELWTPGENNFTGQVVDSLENFTQLCGKASIHFFGHTHGYSRGQSRDHKHLWVNVATAGGAIDNWGEFPNANYEEFVKSQDEYGFVTIEVEAGEDPQFTMKRYGRGDQDIIQDNVLRDSITIINEDIPPSAPQAIYPSGDTLLANCVQLKGSAFLGDEDIHQASHWQVAQGDDFDSTIIAEKWAQNENFYNEINTQENDDLTDEFFTNLIQSDTFYWRVRYRNQNLEWSDWSPSAHFFIEGGLDTISGNLIVNGGAESGIFNWLGDIEALEQSACGSVAPYEGDFNFGVGGICQNESSSGTAHQVLNIDDFLDEIATGKYAIGYSAFMRNYSGSDIPEMYVDVFEEGSLLFSTPIISNATPTWLLKAETAALPETVDSIVVVLKGTRTAGTDNDSYFDNIEAYILDVQDCPPCFGNSNIDVDMDGYCDDLDCDDGNDAIYPGANELCNGIDDDCDGKADLGSTASWTGNAGTTFWGDALNWDQELVPLNCQHVIIDDNALVNIDGNFECLSLEIAINNLLVVNLGAQLIINSKGENSDPSVVVNGTMTINGRCTTKHSSLQGFEVFGTLINNNKLNINDIYSENIVLKNGGRFDSLGVTIFK